MGGGFNTAFSLATAVVNHSKRRKAKRRINRLNEQNRNIQLIGNSSPDQLIMSFPMDIEFTERIISVYEDINSEMASSLCSALRVLARESDDDITIYMHSPGGDVRSGLYIYDVLKLLKCDVRIIACGMCASMAAFLVAAGGTKGKRYIMPNAKMLIHQPIGGVQGQASDIRIHAQNILDEREGLNRILAEACNQPKDRIENDTERDKIFSAQAAVDYGLVDAIAQSLD